MASQVVECGTACTVTLQVEPAPASDERLADYGTLFGWLLAAGVVIFCARGLVNLFWSNSERD